MQGYVRSGIALISVLFISSCSSVGSYQSKRVYKKPLIGTVAEQSIDYEGIDKNPVIVIPGILGSRLIDTKTDEVVWGTFTGKDNIRHFALEKMNSLAHPMRKGKTLGELYDTVVPTYPLDTIEITFLGISLELDAYHDMLNALRFGGYYDKEYTEKKDRKYDTCFQFGYDWRRDLAENAQRLHDFILVKKAYLQKKYEEIYGIKNYDVQFDIMAHSMGGLLARYYLRYGPKDLPDEGKMPQITWRGSEYIDKVIIVGTPNAGYVDTLLELINGLKISPGVPTYPPAIVGTFPTMYQMLPLTETRSVVAYNKKKTLDDPIDLFDPQVWIDMKWGLANPKQDKILKKLLPDIATEEERHMIAIDHLTKCLARAKQFTNALKIKADPPDDVALYLFVGDAVETSRRAFVDMKTGKIKDITYGAGDGKVLTTSALMDMRAGGEWVPFVQSPIKWSAVTFLFAAHMGITKDQVFVTNMLYDLLSAQTRAQTQHIRGQKKEYVF